MNKSRLLAVILAPELYWIALYLFFRWFGARNSPATDAGNSALNTATWLVATVGVAASFIAFAAPGLNRWALLGRLALAGCVGLNACVLRACDSINYPEPGRNSGLMGLWMMAVLLGALVWIAGAALALLLPRFLGRPPG